jgi:molybdate-binding protein/DNA-binding XRE family transcriptional regulator
MSPSRKTDMSEVRNQLAALRSRRGVSAADLARRVGVSRQTIYAIEAGSYVPNTEVALRLSRELEASVEDLFSLPAALKPDEPLSAEILSASHLAPGQAVRTCRVGSRLIGVPVSASPYFLPEADGVIARAAGAGEKANLTLVRDAEPPRKRLLLAGCDPAASLVANLVERIAGVELISAAASSKLALAWLKRGKVHIAGSHLEDAETGEYNLPYIRRELPGEDLTVVTFASWEEGFVVQSGNPKGVRKPEDLAKRHVTFINREPGSGSRSLLDALLRGAGLPPAKVTGYSRVAMGHLAAAYAVAAGDTDCCMATRSAARVFGLDFVPLRSERYDFVMRRESLELPAVQAFMDVLQRSVLRRKLEMLAGYDTARTGAVVL